jgi:hypothetical protein
MFRFQIIPPPYQPSKSTKHLGKAHSVEWMVTAFYATELSLDQLGGEA